MVTTLLIEITWVGRGGQGAVTASRLFASAVYRENYWAQSIVFFGAERRGAPVYAYNRLSDKVIKFHHFVNSPDIAIFFDLELLKITKVLQNLKDGGSILLNYSGSLSSIKNIIPKKVKKIGIVDATGIAVELKLTIAGLHVINTAMLGALSRILNLPSIDAIQYVIKNNWPGKIGEKNAIAATKAYNNIEITGL